MNKSCFSKTPQSGVLRFITSQGEQMLCNLSKTSIQQKSIKSFELFRFQLFLKPVLNNKILKWNADCILGTSLIHRSRNFLLRKLIIVCSVTLRRKLFIFSHKYFISPEKTAYRSAPATRQKFIGFRAGPGAS